MAQLNLNLTKEFLKDLKIYMKHKGLSTKSEAIRMALHEVVALMVKKRTSDFQSWLGAGLATDTPKKNKFKSEDDLWKAG